MTIEVAIVDDQPLVRAGLRMIVEAAPDMQVVAEAGDGRGAIDIAHHNQPDLILMDVRMPAIDGIEATRQITSAENCPRIVILTTFDVDEYVYGALRAGASGFLLKDVSPEQLVDAIRTVAAGESLLAPTVTTRLIQTIVHAKTPAAVPAAVGELTPRELEIFMLVARGLSNAEIADHLVLSGATVKTHVTRVLTKLGLRDRVQAVVLAYETAIIEPGSPRQHPLRE